MSLQGLISHASLFISIVVFVIPLTAIHVCHGPLTIVVYGQARRLSPFNVPLLEQEPLLRLYTEDVQVLVQAADHEYLLVVLNWLSSEKLLRFLKAALIHPQNHIGLRIEVEAVADPAVVAAKYEDLGVIQGKRAKRVTRRPRIILVHDRHRLPLLLEDVGEAIQALYRLQRRLVH